MTHDLAPGASHAMFVDAVSKWSDHTVSQELTSFFAREDDNTAGLLLRLAEFDARKLYVPAGYPSMFAYCVGKLRRSPDAISKRIHAARTARRFPAIFAAVAEGRLSVSAVVQIATYLTDENVDAMLAAAANQTRPQIQQLLADRFPKPDVPTALRNLTPMRLDAQQAPGPVLEGTALEPASQRTGTCAGARSSLRPLSSERIAVQFTMDKSTEEKLRYVQRLLGHENPVHELPGVFDRALDALARELEKKKFAATAKPRARAALGSTTARHIPAGVKRAVWERDWGQCTFVAADGHRCPARTHLEYDHVEPVARGGRSSTSNVRLRCRAHNQYEAERAFGVEFMRHKRERARDGATKRSSRLPADGSDACGIYRSGDDVVPWLLRLGLKAREAREAANSCASLREASLEERVRVALSYFRPRRSLELPTTSSGGLRPANPG